MSQTDSTVLDRPAVKKPKVRHAYHQPYTHTLCGIKRTTPIANLRTAPVPGAEYCVVCWHMHFGEFPA